MENETRESSRSLEDEVRVLSHEILPLTGMLLMLMLAITFANMFVASRYRGGVATALFHGASCICLVGLFFSLMEHAILDMPFEWLFKRIGFALLLLSLLLFVAIMFIVAFRKRQKPVVFNPMENLKTVFNTVDDIVLVADDRGQIIDINYPEQLKLMQLDADTLQNFIGKLRQHSVSGELCDFSDNLIKSPTRTHGELFIGPWERWFVLTMAPILSKDELLGYILILQDISNIRKTEQALNLKNVELETARCRLAGEIALAGALDAEKERLRVLEHIQTMLLHRIEHAVSSAQDIKNRHKVGSVAYKDDVMLLADQLRRIYKEVRMSVGDLSGKERGT